MEEGRDYGDGENNVSECGRRMLLRHRHGRPGTGGRRAPAERAGGALPSRRMEMRRHDVRGASERRVPARAVRINRNAGCVRCVYACAWACALSPHGCTHSTVPRTLGGLGTTQAQGASMAA